MPIEHPSICRRIEALRTELFGERGKSEMARRLDIRPSTYDRYERDRVPPADLLRRVADVADVTLEWLIAGEGPKHPERIADMEAEILTRRFKELLVARPEVRPLATSFFSWAEALPPTPTTKAPVDSTSKAVIPVLASSNERFAGSIDDRVREQRAAAKGLGAGTLQTSATCQWTGSHSPSKTTAEVLNAPDSDEAFIGLPTDCGYSETEQLAAVRVLGDDMVPSWRPGSYALADLSRTPQDGDDCIAITSDSGTLVLRQFRTEQADVLLVPTNVREEVTRTSRENLTLLAPVVGHVETQD